MALWLLAGPFTIRSLENVPLISASAFTWCPGVGLTCILAEPDNPVFSSRLYLVTLDGVAVEQSVNARIAFSWWASRNRMVTMNGDGSEYQWETIAFLSQQTAPSEQMLDVPHGDNRVRGHRYVKLDDRRLYAAGGTRLWRQVQGVIPDVLEGPDFPFNLVEVFPGQHNYNVWVTGGGIFLDGTGCFYDTRTLQLASPVYKVDMTLPGHLSFFGYAPEYDVFFTVHRDPDSTIFYEGPWHIRVWAREVRPTLLSDVEVFEGEPKSGQIVTYRVQATGADDDPAIGERINWSLTGAGLLWDVQSKTDDSGYAYAKVQYRLGEVGTTIMKATLLC